MARTFRQTDLASGMSVRSGAWDVVGIVILPGRGLQVALDITADEAEKMAAALVEHAAYIRAATTTQATASTVAGATASAVAGVAASAVTGEAA